MTAALCFATALPAQRELTLEALLQQTLTAANEGRFQEALAGFESLKKTFGREPEFQASATQRVVLPLHAHAHLVMDEAEEAIPLLEAFLRSFAGRSNEEAFVLFSLGQAQQMAGNWEASREAYARFVRTYPDAPEAAIAQLRFGETFLDEGKVEDALDAMDRFYASPAPYALRIQARLRALQLSRDNSFWDRAASYILDTQWSVETMPELAVLAFAALEVGDYLMGEERFAEAVRAYSLVPGYSELVKEQANRIASTQSILARTTDSSTSATGGVWATYYRQLLAGLQALQAQLIASPDYTGNWLLRYGQAFAQAGRPYEAWTLFQSVAEDPVLLPAVRRDGHYRWIIATQALKRWDEARSLAYAFIERYENAPEAPYVLFLLAYAYQQDGRPLEAIEVLDELLQKYREHRLTDRWIFTRGFNKILAEQFVAARADFAQYSREFPSGNQALNARLWHALAWFFEKNYPPALKELEALQDTTPAEHYLRPEIAYRRASVLYAMQSFEPALQAVDAYLGAFPEDRNRAEATVLKGDVLMGLGRLEEAVVAFEAVTPEARALYPYAIFQIGKIHRALEDYTALIEHFETYLKSGDGKAVPRQTEALYLIGWAMQNLGRDADVLPLYLEAFERHANDLQAMEMYSILEALNGLHTKLRKASEPRLGDAPEAVFLRMPRFRDWISLRIPTLRDDGQLTAYSRLRLYEIEHLRKADPESVEAEILLSNLAFEVSVQDLDAKGLMVVGKSLQARGEAEAQLYFEAILQRFPSSMERVPAWIGLAEALKAQGAFDAAAEWLALVQDQVTHPDAPRGMLAYASVLFELGRFTEIQPVVETLLRLRSARGRPHAEGLMLLARAEEAMGRPERAIPIYQRVYNVYRAYADLVGQAYVASAILFETMGEAASARDTWKEVLYFDDLTDATLQARAQVEYERLKAIVPEIGIANAGEAEAL